MTPRDPAPRTVIDVSELPGSAVDHRSPIWWGNLFLLAIETTMFLLTFTSYFYLWQNFEHWPPPRVDRFPVLYDAEPRLGTATAISVLMLIALAGVLWMDRACIQKHVRSVVGSLILVVVLGMSMIWQMFLAFHDLHFEWDANAYASIAWTILGLHLLHTIVATAESVLMLSWVAMKPLDDKHARDIRVTAVYWYWVIGMWTLIYALLFWSPRII